MEPAPDNFVCTDPNSCADNTYQTSEFQSVDPSADENEFVNYTKVAADYREYGERTPRDQNITQAAAGNNLSASIPPSIEDEVVDYEEEIKLTEDNAVCWFIICAIICREMREVCFFRCLTGIWGYPVVLLIIMIVVISWKVTLDIMVRSVLLKIIVGAFSLLSVSVGF